MTKLFYAQKQRIKILHDEVVSLRNTYMHAYIIPHTQSIDSAITQYYIVQQPHMVSDCK